MHQNSSSKPVLAKPMAAAPISCLVFMALDGGSGYSSCFLVDVPWMGCLYQLRTQCVTKGQPT